MNLLHTSLYTIALLLCLYVTITKLPNKKWLQIEHKSLTHIVDNIQNVDDRRRRLGTNMNSYDQNAPSVALLLSFPNSGTTYAMDMIHKVTNTATANVYGSSFALRDGNIVRFQQDSIPVYDDHETGPFLFSDYDLPKSYILTKTHCGGYCWECPPDKYVRSRLQFFQECRTGTKIKVDEGSGKVIEEVVRIDSDLVKKAIHLIRNPFDNVGSRFHYLWKTKKSDDPEFEQKYPFSPKGFQLWCYDQDNKFWELEEENYPDVLGALADKVPCHSEFYKYVQWHNWSFDTTKHFLNIPTLIVQYEHFRHHMQITVGIILKFLDLPRISDPPLFNFQKYEYFTNDDKINVYNFIRCLATEETWKHVKIYFEAEESGFDLDYLPCV